MDGHDEGITCPACGHALSMYRPPAPDRAERAAIRVTDHVATWWFPTAIVVGVAAWLACNAAFRPIEPYPVLVIAMMSAFLATVAACQGPLILVAQRRSAMHDRAREEEAFRVAMHAEADIHLVQAKLDALAEQVRDLGSHDG